MSTDQTAPFRMDYDGYVRSSLPILMHVGSIATPILLIKNNDLNFINFKNYKFFTHNLQPTSVFNVEIQTIQSLRTSVINKFFVRAINAEKGGGSFLVNWKRESESFTVL